MDFAKSEELMEFVKRNYVALCFGIAIFLLMVMLGTSSDFLRGLSGLAGAIAGFAGLSVLRQRRRTESEGTPESQPQPQ